MRPFGGSTISDAWRCGSPRSSQCGGGETAPPTSPPGVLAAFSSSKSALSCSSCCAARRSRSANSSSVSTLRVPELLVALHRHADHVGAGPLALRDPDRPTPCAARCSALAACCAVPTSGSVPHKHGAPAPSSARPMAHDNCFSCTDFPSSVRSAAGGGTLFGAMPRQDDSRAPSYPRGTRLRRSGPSLGCSGISTVHGLVKIVGSSIVA